VAPTCSDNRWTWLTVARRRPALALGLALWIGPRIRKNEPPWPRSSRMGHNAGSVVGRPV
jgi:hypothetical protein